MRRSRSISGTNVVSASGSALEDVGEIHGKKKARISWPFHFLAPRDRLELPTKWLIPLAAGLYQLSIR